MPSQIARIVNEVPKSGWMKIMKKIGKVQSMLFSTENQLAKFRDQNQARVRINMGLANSEGWIFTGPKEIQRIEPRDSKPINQVIIKSARLMP